MKGNKRKAECEKTNCKFVGVLLRTCPQKGITLIALIITIIVMLILVGVTINIALNGGLFQQAKIAANDTQIQADKEQLLSAVVGAIGTDAKVDFNKLDSNLPNKWTKVASKTYKSPKGNIFTVDEKGTIEYKGKYTAGEETPVAFNWESVGLTVETGDTYAEYKTNWLFLNFSKDGKLEIVNSNREPVSTIDATDSKYINNGMIDFIDENFLGFGLKGRIKIQMNENKMDINLIFSAIEEDGITEGEPTITTLVKGLKDVYSNEEVLKAVGEKGGTYTGTWKVIKRDESGKPIKLITTSEVDWYELGCDDPRAIEENSIEGTEPTEEERVKRAIWSYKNAVNTLNTVAKESTGILNARSIKLEDIYDIIGEKNNKTETICNYYYNTTEQKVYYKYKTEGNNWSEAESTNMSSMTIVDDNGNTVLIDSTGDEATITTISSLEFPRYFSEEELELLNFLPHRCFYFANTFGSLSGGLVSYAICKGMFNRIDNMDFIYLPYQKQLDGFSRAVIAVLDVVGL